MKTCTKCGATKALKEFYKRKAAKDGLMSYCKECHTTTVKKWYENNKERCKENQLKWQKENKNRVNFINNEWRKRNPEKHKNSKLKSIYGISLEQWNEMLVKQNNKCSICSTEFSLLEKPVVDHCHTTGKVRDLLCKKCNTALGMAQEDTNILFNLIEYIKRHK